jgi:hypothetical protein
MKKIIIISPKYVPVTGYGKRIIPNLYPEGENPPDPGSRIRNTASICDL